MGFPYRCDDSECIGNGMSSPTIAELRWNSWDCPQCGKTKYMTESERLEHLIGEIDELVDTVKALGEKVESLVSGNNGL